MAPKRPWWKRSTRARQVLRRHALLPGIPAASVGMFWQAGSGCGNFGQGWAGLGKGAQGVSGEVGQWMSWVQPSA